MLWQCWSSGLCGMWEERSMCYSSSYPTTLSLSQRHTHTHRLPHTHVFLPIAFPFRWGGELARDRPSILIDTSPSTRPGPSPLLPSSLPLPVVTAVIVSISTNRTTCVPTHQPCNHGYSLGHHQLHNCHVTRFELHRTYFLCNSSAKLTWQYLRWIIKEIFASRLLVVISLNQELDTWGVSNWCTHHLLSNRQPYWNS